MIMIIMMIVEMGVDGNDKIGRGRWCWVTHGSKFLVLGKEGTKQLS